MVRKSSVVAVAGARKAGSLVMMIVFAILAVLVCAFIAYKLLGLLVAIGFVTVGRMEPAPNSGTEVAIHLAVIVILFGVGWILIKIVRHFQSDFHVPMDVELARAAEVVHEMENRAKNRAKNFGQSLQDAVDKVKNKDE